MAEQSMMSLADKLKGLKQQIAEVQVQEKILNEEVKQVELLLIEKMIDNECESFARGNKTISLVNSQYYNPIVEKKNELYEVLQEQGYGHLFTVNSNTMRSFIKEVVESNENEIPYWMEGLVTEYSENKIRLSKRS